MGTHDGHRKRMLEAFLASGIDGMHQHEILEMLLFFAIPRRDTNEIAHRLMENFGSISAVFDAPVEELVKVEGIGMNAASLIKMIPQLARAYLSDAHNPTIVASFEDAAACLLPKFIGRIKETVFLLCLDNKNKVIACVMVGEGSVNSAEISTRRVAELAIKYNAAAIVIAHNHPGGTAIPSKDDIATTKKLIDFCNGIGMPLLDHLVVSEGDYVSMAQTGTLKMLLGK
ncbi:MAG: DNA repair protein RadC [Clostridiaceae bacterium]|nr:DNA repair protein RadC [Clostridiaceae bacterium]